MTNLRRGAALILVGMSLAALTACDDDSTAASTDEQVALTSVSPAGGSADVDPSSSVTLEFDHSMAGGMEEYCAVHQGGLDGAEVPGHWEWSHDHQQLTFSPDQPLEHGQQYTLHVGGGMQDQQGHPMNFEQHGHAMGGAWVAEDMLGSGMMMGGHDHTGDGWQHQNGMYGMMFTFTTSG